MICVWVCHLLLSLWFPFFGFFFSLFPSLHPPHPRKHGKYTHAHSHTHAHTHTHTHTHQFVLLGFFVCGFPFSTSFSSPPSPLLLLLLLFLLLFLSPFSSSSFSSSFLLLLHPSPLSLLPSLFLQIRPHGGFLRQQRDRRYHWRGGSPCVWLVILPHGDRSDDR